MVKSDRKEREKKFRKFRKLLPKDDLNRAILYEALIRMLRKEEVKDDYPSYIKNFYPYNIAEKYTYDSESRIKLKALFDSRFKRMEGRYLQGPRTGLGFKKRGGRKSGKWKLHPHVKDDLERAFEDWKSAYDAEMQAMALIPNIPCYVYWVIREISKGKTTISKLLERLRNPVRSADIKAPEWVLKRVIEFAIRLSEQLGLIRNKYWEQFEYEQKGNSLPIFVSDRWKAPVEKEKYFDGENVPFIVTWGEQKNPELKVVPWAVDVEGDFEAGETFEPALAEHRVENSNFAPVAQKLDVPPTFIQSPWVRFMYAKTTKGWRNIKGLICGRECSKSQIEECESVVDKLLGSCPIRTLARNLDRNIVVFFHCPEEYLSAGISVEMFIPTSFS